MHPSLARLNAVWGRRVALVHRCEAILNRAPRLAFRLRTARRRKCGLLMDLALSAGCGGESHLGW